MGIAHAALGERKCGLCCIFAAQSCLVLHKHFCTVPVYERFGTEEGFHGKFYETPELNSGNEPRTVCSFVFSTYVVADPLEESPRCSMHELWVLLGSSQK